MREYLAPLVWRRYHFEAVVVDRGVERNWGQPDGPPTLLLRDLACAETGQPLAEHVWAPLPPELATLYPFPAGALIRFRAKVTPYRRFNCARDDYQLTQLRDIVWVGAGAALAAVG